MDLTKYLVKSLPSRVVFAHCDIPCGIYDPHTMQMAAHTVIRMTDLINQTKEEKTDDSDEAEEAAELRFTHQIARLTKVKEEHAEIIKHEVRVIWADYFKPEHLYKLPELNQLVFDIMKLSSKAKQEIDLEVAQKLLENVQKFAEIFYKTKGLEIVRIPSGYPTGGEVVSHK